MSACSDLRSYEVMPGEKQSLEEMHHLRWESIDYFLGERNPTPMFVHSFSHSYVSIVK